ncbi:MAG TPA: NAD(P)-dependent alcohol dehydrogenase [Pseudobdellovibrionaceae bacterium]|nr:NAD(P)-dependent alcohol dehydrogenase [Pseudobdellovibrionaceae bacterium]
MKTKAYANHAADKPFVPYDFERRSPGAGDVAIDIDFCGICHSDIHTARGEWGPTPYPCVPGHEIVGRVRDVGTEVKRFKVGDIVGVGCMVDSCRQCGSCKEGLEQFCEKGFTGTYGAPAKDGGYTKGGYSSHIVVDERFVLSIPKNLDLAASAPLLCAGITTYSPMKYVGLGRGDKIAILGLGGLGHMGVKLAVSFGAEVTVLSHSSHKREDAKRLGAHHFVLTDEPGNAEKYAGHFDYVLDTVSAKHDLSQALGMLKRDGTLMMVGASEKPLDLHVFSLIMGRRKMMGSLIGGIPETQEMLDHCGKHGITSDIELIPAEKINEAYERTLKSDVKYRFVIDCRTL